MTKSAVICSAALFQQGKNKSKKRTGARPRASHSLQQAQTDHKRERCDDRDAETNVSEADLALAAQDIFHSVQRRDSHVLKITGTLF